MKRICVDAGWRGLASPERVGAIDVSSVRGVEVAAFSYDSSWLARHPGLVLDPLLAPTPGPQYFAKGKLPGLMHDSAPDRWGRMLIRRREARQARGENRRERTLAASDYLLGVSDEGRVGGLRYKTAEAGPYLAEPQANDVPPIARLRALEAAAWVVEADGDIAGVEEALAMLLAPGSSLGGARPKATVADSSGRLWVAKFPSRRDEWDSGAWEAAAYRLAAKAGLRTAESDVCRLSKSGHTFLLQRFDRDRGRRVHFASAMCLLGCSDGDGAATGIGYLDLAELVARCGAEPGRDLEELWRRLVFNILASNTDDHLRNHGFLLSDKGWRISPVFDVNPQPGGSALALNVTETDNRASLDLAREVAPHFRLTNARRDAILAKCRAAVAGWRAVARDLKLPKREIDRMEPAFAGAGL